MPTSPSSPLKFRTAGFTQYGLKADLSDGAFPRGVDISRRMVCIRPSHAPWPYTVVPCQCREGGLGDVPPFERRSRSTPGALAPVRVMLSRSIHA